MHATPAIVLPIMDLVHLVHLGLQETIPEGGRHHVSSLVLKQKQPKFGPSLSVSNSNSLSKIRLMIVKQNERNDDVGRFWMVSDE